MSKQAMQLWQRDIEEYWFQTNDPEPLRSQAEEFLWTVQLGMLPRPRGPGIAETVAMGKKLLDQGCEDPLVRTYYGRAVFGDQEFVPALPVLVDALNDFWESPYSPEYRRAGLFTLYMAARTCGRVLQPEALKDVVGTALNRVAGETIDPGMERIVLHELTCFNQECRRGWKELQSLHEACEKVPNMNPWLLHMIGGRSHIALAWHHRGGDWAYKVKPENWPLFQENLRQAAEHYAKAMKLHPEYPEAAADMITVAMAGESERTPQEWFDQAVAAQFDYMPAYFQLRWALRPRWGGSLEEMYRFGCQCADTQRYDTDVPFVLLYAVTDIDDESGCTGEIWHQEGVYPRVKRMLEELAKAPSRGEGAAACYPGKRSLMSLHAIVAGRAGEYADARRLLDELGDRFDRAIVNEWCIHPEWELAMIYLCSGKGADDVEKAWQTVGDTRKPVSNDTIEEARSLYQRGLAADDNGWSKAFCQSWLDELECFKVFNAGRWYEKKFDPKLLCWGITGGTWSTENERSAIGRGRRQIGPVRVRVGSTPPLPLEIEFDVEAPVPPPYPLTLGLFIPEGGQDRSGGDSYHQFFVRTGEDLAGIAIDGESKTVPCPLKSVNRLRVQLADGRAVLHVNDQFCLDHSEADFHPQSTFNLGCQNSLYPDKSVRISNVRIRKWDPTKGSPAAKKKSESKAGADEKGRSDDNSGGTGSNKEAKA